MSNRAAIADTTALGFGPTPAVFPAGSCKNLGQGKYVAFSSVEDLPYESVWLLDVTIHPTLPYKIVKAVDISSSKSGDEWKLLEKNGVWGEWVEFVTATPPQEFDLPLAEGLEPIEPCRYSKDQFGRVLVNIDCNPTTGSVSIGENQSLSIGTLPEGFRPAHYTSNACEVIVGQSRYIGTFDINEYGAITLWTAAPSASIIIGSVLFDTA